MPLVDMHVAASDVNEFWGRQDWDLTLPPDSGLSNCVYCFLKGGATLRKVHREMEDAQEQEGREQGEEGRPEVQADAGCLTGDPHPRGV